MRHNSIPATCWFVCVLLILFGSPVAAQFKVEPRGDLLGFNGIKPREYYSPMRYNRVEGWFPAFGIRLNPPGLSGLSFFCDAGYGLSNKRARYNLGMEYELSSKTKLTVGGKYFDDICTNDDWIISSIENSFAAFLLREDFQDLFAARGFSFWVVKDYEDWLHFRLVFWTGRYQTLEKKTDWSLFGGNKLFRPNPAIARGRENKLRLEFIWDRLDNPIFPLQGWYVEGALEKGGDFLNEDFQQTGIFLTAKFFQPSFANQRMVFQLRYGQRSGGVIGPQHLLDLGGIGTLRGYRYKEFQNGRNMALAMWQYYFNGDLLQRLPLQRIPFYSGLGLILFVEVGSLWNGTEQSPLPDHPEWKSDLGFSLSLTGDFVRVDFARRLDRSKKSWVVTFRVLPRW